MFKSMYITSLLVIFTLTVIFAPESEAQVTDSLTTVRQYIPKTKSGTRVYCRTCGDKDCAPKIKVKRPPIRIYIRKENRSEDTYINK